jgi:hypothetical protein
MTYQLCMIVMGAGAQKYVVQLVNCLLCDVILYLPTRKANFVFKYVGCSWIQVWGTQLDCAEINQSMCDQIIMGADERENMASWVLYFVSLVHYASKMTDHVEKSAKSASCIQMRSDEIYNVNFMLTFSRHVKKTKHVNIINDEQRDTN